MTIEQHRELEEDFYNQAPCGYFTTSLNGLILKVNDTLLQWLGFQREEVVNQKYFTDFLSIGGKIYHETHYQPLLTMQGFVKEINFDFLTKDGNKIPILINTNKFTHRLTGEEFYNSTVFDITQRKKYEIELLLERKKAEKLVDKLSKANADLDKFAMVVSHDLKSPLTNISLISELLLETYQEQLDESGVTYLNFLNDASKKLSDFIADVLSFYKGTNISNQNIKEFDLVEVINSIIALLNVHQKYQINFPQGKIIIKTNKNVLEQILINLITNAIKYNDKEQVIIDILYKEDSEYYYFSIKDNGRGIEKKNFDKIFQLFSTLNLKDKDGNQGHGVGLSTVKKLVESQQGEITLESELHKGTTFNFTLKKELNS
jgi:PAS domain S-box-containing protein